MSPPSASSAASDGVDDAHLPDWLKPQQCCAKHYCGQPQCALGNQKKPHIPPQHRCLNCDEFIHGMLCAYRVNSDDDEKDIASLALHLNPSFQAKFIEGRVGHLCKLCYNVAHTKAEGVRKGVELELNSGTSITAAISIDDTTFPPDPNRIDQDNGGTTTETSIGNRDDLLKDLYTLSDVEVTTTKTNSTVAVPRNGTPDASKCTRLKSFRKVINGEVVSEHSVLKVTLNQLTKFATHVKISGVRRKKKVDVCEAIVDKKAAFERALATGEGEMLDSTGGNVTLNRKRLINVLCSQEYRPDLNKIDNALSAGELTDHIKANEEPMKAFINLYNSDKSIFSDDHHPEVTFNMDASSFTALPITYWKTLQKQVMKVGKVMILH